MYIYLVGNLAATKPICNITSDVYLEAIPYRCYTGKYLELQFIAARIWK